MIGRHTQGDAPPGRENRPDAANIGAASDRAGNLKSTSTVAQSADTYAEHFRARVLQDAINEGLAITWERRRQAFLDARPRPGDFHGKATPEQLRARWVELTGIANACAARAAVSGSHHDGIDDDVWEAIAC